jgi:hypothetical protein
VKSSPTCCELFGLLFANSEITAAVRKRNVCRPQSSDGLQTRKTTRRVKNCHGDATIKDSRNYAVRQLS